MNTAAATSSGQSVQTRPMPEARQATATKLEAMLYPNPLRLGQPSFVQLPSNHGVSQLQISNTLGQLLSVQKVIEAGAHDLQIDITDQINNNGTYLVRALDNKGQLVWTKRMLVH